MIQYENFLFVEVPEFFLHAPRISYNGVLYELICTSEEVDEEKAREIVERVHLPLVAAYRDYTGLNGSFFSPKISYSSLRISANVSYKRFAILKNIK